MQTSIRMTRCLLGVSLKKRVKYLGQWKKPDPGTHPPNTVFRIEIFGRICQTFDEHRTRWVYKMGFGGLLHFVADMHLPRHIAYWIMTRIDPFNYTLRADDRRVFFLSKNQVHWILGIPNSGTAVPTYKSLNDEMLGQVNKIMSKYGKSWNTKSKKTGRKYTSEGIPLNSKLMERVEGLWEENESLSLRPYSSCCHLRCCSVPHSHPDWRLTSFLH